MVELPASQPSLSSEDRETALKKIINGGLSIRITYQSQSSDYVNTVLSATSVTLMALVIVKLFAYNYYTDATGLVGTDH